ncbi:hypothetical protein BH10PLA2_BH10PLA2_03780 [soil metagenome]
MSEVDLDRCRRQLESSTPLVAGWMHERALRSLEADGSAESARVLEDAVIEFQEDERGPEAFAALERLASAGNTPAREALCRLVVQDAFAPALEIVMARGYVPHEERQRAVFYFLLGRWKEYDALDFDRRLLREAYESAEPDVRNRLAAQARRQGRVDWVDVAAGGRLGKHLAQMSAVEWRAALTVLARKKCWGDLWRLAQDAPPGWCAAILRVLPRNQVTDPDRAGLKELFELAQAWPPQDFAQAYFHRKTIKAHDHEVRCLALNDQGTVIASGSADRTVRLWEVPSGKHLATCVGHTDWINALFFDDELDLLIGAGRDGRLFSWRSPEGTRHRRLRRRRRPFICMQPSSPKALAVCGTADGMLFVWDPRTGSELVSVDAHDGAVACLAVDERNDLCVTGGADCQIRIWSLPAGKRLRSMAAHKSKRRPIGLPIETDSVLSLAISPDGTMLASGGTDGEVILWSLPGAGQIVRLDAHMGHVTSLTFAPDSRTLFSGGADRKIHLWSVSDGNRLSTLSDHFGDINILRISPSGETLASCGGGGLGIEHTLRLWRLPDAVPSAILGGHARAVT